jgi:ABC-type sugar transport system substrate-binding protein
MKRIISKVVAVVLLLTLVLSGCASDKKETSEATSEEQAGAGDGKYTIVVMPKLVGIPYFTATGEGALKAGEDLGVNVIYNGPTVADAAEQVKMLEDYITQGVDAICVAPNDAAALDPVLKKAKDAGILVLDWDTEATKDLVDASIHQISDKEFGEHMLQSMVDNMGTEEGEWAIVTGGLSASNLNAWIKYAEDYAKEKYPKLELVADPFPTDEKQDVAISTTKDIMKAYPDVKGILCVSTPAPIGAAIAIRELGLQDKVTVVGSAVEADCQDVLSDGSLDVGSLWSCEDLGYLTVGVAKALLDGKTLEDGMDIEGFGTVALNGEKDVILGAPQDYTK